MTDPTPIIKDEIAALDLDGTVVDYDAGLKERMAELMAPGEPPYLDRNARAEAGFYDNEDAEPPYIKARRKLIQGTPGFWRNLKPLKLGFDVVEDLTSIGFIIDILTKGPKKQPLAWSEKVEWCLEHLPDANMNIATIKARFYGKVLVDDFPPYFLDWLAVRPRGLVVCVAQPWNAKFANVKDTDKGKPGVMGDPHPNVFRYDGTNREELQRRLQHAFDRKPGEH